MKSDKKKTSETGLIYYTVFIGKRCGV